jgi:imidazolonepropionase-like amidohydrolase
VLAEALGGLRVVRPDTPLESRKVVEEMVDKGADWIKIFRQSKSWCLYRNALPIFDAESFRAIMDTARECGKKVSCHISWSDDIEHITEMGVDTAEHSVLDELSDQIIQKFIERDMSLIPTLVVPGAGDVDFYKRLSCVVEERGSRILEPLPLQHLKGFLDFYLGGKYPPSKKEVEENSISMIDTSIFERNHARAQANALRIHKAGGRVGVGTDCGGAPMLIFGFCYFEELKQMVNAGFSNHEVLVAATSGNARIIDMEDRVGRIEKGKWADLIAVKGNPLEDIAAMQDIQMVCKDGEIFRHISD